MKESKMYKVLFFHPYTAKDLEEFLEAQLAEGLELIAATGNYFIFKRISGLVCQPFFGYTSEME